ncbi:glutathionylspermidine synthase family protein [Neptuniibacter sp. QD37_11]|uniref:glutathionylspermidine synthase family protein n=1 Tax=Neptuniibacter sp. QD37_11 TaxID=3398209 RepID=UPI0039F63635
MKAKYFPINFSIEKNIQPELPITSSLFGAEFVRNDDLESLFSFPKEHQDNMPFYVFNGKEANHITEVSERAYDALCSAVEWLDHNREYVPRFFGKDFCEKYPEFIEYAFWTYQNNVEATYGRFDMAFDPDTGAITGIYEFNGDTPVMLFESTILQNDLTQQVRKAQGNKYDQHNFYYESSVKGIPRAFRSKWGHANNVGIVAHAEYIEDIVTCETLFQIYDSAAGITPYIDHIDNLQDEAGNPEAESIFYITDQPLRHLFKLQPWEEVVESCYDDIISNWREWCEKTKIYEPAWRWFLANKGIWALITHILENDVAFQEKYGDLPFLKTYMSEASFEEAGQPYVQKPLIGRLSNNIVIHDGKGNITFESDGSYGDIDCVYQEYCAPGRVIGRNNFIVGMWMGIYPDTVEPLVMQAASLCIREFDKPVLDIKNERFIPHLIELS